MTVRISDHKQHLYFLATEFHANDRWNQQQISENGLEKWKVKEFLLQRLSGNVQPQNPHCVKYTSNRQYINEFVTQISSVWSCFDKFQMHLTCDECYENFWKASKWNREASFCFYSALIISILLVDRQAKIQITKGNT